VLLLQLSEFRFRLDRARVRLSEGFGASTYGALIAYLKTLRPAILGKIKVKQNAK
jgi:hypothetical protein